jgi:2,4-dienoyl-CoA reductase (NADPH2)
MDDEDIAAVIEGFRAAAALAAEAGLDGVEINAGQHSLVRQFLSGLTNQRNDQWGTDRLTFAREVIAATRQGLGPDRVVSLRLSCDEMAPWAGITAEMANDIAIELAGLVDVLVVVKGSIFTVQATRPDHHEPTGFNIELCRSIRTAIGESVPVVLQGSVIDTGQAEWAVSNDVCDLVEMTRGQLADAELVAKLRAGAPEQIRPCIRCNQTCQVRDARNPIIGCVGDPTTGHETDEPWSMARRGPGRRILVIGAGPAGLEAARVAAERGHTVSVVDRSKATGGVAGRAGPGQPLVQWLAAECARLGVTIETDVEISDPFAHRCQPEVVVVASGSRPGQRTYEVADGAVVLDVLDSVPDAGVVAIWDPIGGPIAVAVAENLGARAVLITPDQIAGNELSRTGDLAPANTRLQQGGVTIERRAVLRAVRPGEIEIEDRFTGVRRTLAADLLVDAGFRMPAESFADLSGPKVFRIGDCVAPRTIAEAVLEGRRVALSL